MNRMFSNIIMFMTVDKFMSQVARLLLPEGWADHSTTVMLHGRSWKQQGPRLGAWTGEEGRGGRGQGCVRGGRREGRRRRGVGVVRRVGHKEAVVSKGREVGNCRGWKLGGEGKWG